MSHDRTEVPKEFAPVVIKATDKQKAYLLGLLDAREIDSDARQAMIDRINGDEVSKSRATDWIGRLLDKPKLASARGNPVGRISVKYEEVLLDDGKEHRVGYVVGAGPNRVPRGRYALDTSGHPNFINNTTFFKLWVGARNGWKVFVQASDDEFEVDFWDKKRWVIEAIAKAPEESMALYGRELGKCGMCGRTLTNDESRELGIGPVCRSKL